jgi:exodeoxyribonuclease VII large subunit
MTSLFDLPFEEEEPPADTAPRAAGRSAAPRPSLYSVSELTTEIRSLLETGFGAIAVEGEISNCRLWNTGILYFTLKDTGAQIKAVMFRTAVRSLKFKAADGMHVIARGRLGVYEPKGEYQLVVDALEPQGVGALQLAFEQLKRALAAEGLFDQARKRPLPLLPRKVGIVTSLDGAALRDIVSVLRARHPTLSLVVRPARVQGDGAALDVARGINAIGRVAGVDVIIVGRGGGSMEDLWAFNEEIVARAIAACPIPVISAVGHETDFTIADFAADVRAPTPSAAAELVVARKDAFAQRLDRQAGGLHSSMRRRILAARAQIHRLERRHGLAGLPATIAMRGRHAAELTHALRRLMRQAAAVGERRVRTLQLQLERHDLRRRLGVTRERLSNSDTRLGAAIWARQQRAAGALAGAAGRLENLSPLAVLGRGYAMCWDEDRRRILRTASDVTLGDTVHVTLAQGQLECEVKDRQV